MYSAAFHKAIESDELPQAVRLADYIQTYIKPSAFYDFGCSTGLYEERSAYGMVCSECHGASSCKSIPCILL